MNGVWLPSLFSVGVVSLISLIGALFLARSDRTEEGETSPFMLFLIAMAVGALLGDVFIHLWPEGYEHLGTKAAAYVAAGFATFFLIEKALHWRHHHQHRHTARFEPYGVMNLVGDGLHNFIDGALIAASYLVSLPIGFATTIAVVLHEVPQELGDYAILRSAGFSKRSAVTFNFLSALTAFIGTILVLALGINLETTAQQILVFTAGGFVYLAFVLMKRLGEDLTIGRAFGQVTAFLVGATLMWLIKFVE